MDFYFGNLRTLQIMMPVDFAMSHVCIYLGPFGCTFPSPHHLPSDTATNKRDERNIMFFFFLLLKLILVQ